ncbi:methionine--tRNA ligase, mitochondrial [Anthonomus grandis grandis]|uniref:methionine--tRNA ligase, mitochondrial n=1 Tax=Anthonomus grandis grandis TaxID=2921223 RepID=UPI0021654205|nr:methionine--tRNA ligase, mitochondrial [Anthonomus grandis grandis]
MCAKSLIFTRKYSVATKTVSFFTTPIYYVNAKPHIGHLYSSLIADASQRWQKLKSHNQKIIFSTGTDEHGTKIQRAAKMHKTTLNGYCDAISREYRDLADNFSVEYSDFIRTSEVRHKSTVQAFWEKLASKGLIYKSTYQGYYCVSDETFLSESQLKEVEQDGRKLLVSTESGHPVEWSEEANYIFKLSSFREDLVYWLKQNERAVIPQKFHKILLDLINSGDALKDISVSRPSSRVHWGIPVPNDPDQTVYVWLDALVNYLTAAGYTHSSKEDFNKVWPPDLQVIGKDILKFHGVYWPAFLMAADLEPPRCILCHSHWTVDDEKMSKSKRNVVNPMEKGEVYTRDGLRYFLLREGVNHSDGNYNDTKVLRLLNAELADTLGNLLSRCCGKSLNPNQEFPRINFDKISRLDVTKQLIKHLENLPNVCAAHYDDYNFYKCADAIVATLHSANLFFESLKPWELKKSPETKEDLDAALHLAMECLRVCGILLQPLTPNISEALLDKLSVLRSERTFEDSRRFSWENREFSGRKLGAGSAVLFKRIVLAEEKIKKAQKG